MERAKPYAVKVFTARSRFGFIVSRRKEWRKDTNNGLKDFYTLTVTKNGVTVYEREYEHFHVTRDEAGEVQRAISAHVRQTEPADDDLDPEAEAELRAGLKKEQTWIEKLRQQRVSSGSTQEKQPA